MLQLDVDILCIAEFGIGIGTSKFMLFGWLRNGTPESRSNSKRHLLYNLSPFCPYYIDVHFAHKQIISAHQGAVLPIITAQLCSCTQIALKNTRRRPRLERRAPPGASRSSRGALG